MVNHPNRRLTPKRKEFLLKAIAHGGKVFCSSAMYTNAAPYFVAASGFPEAVKISDTAGSTLVRMGFIERVVKAKGNSTVRWGIGYLYRVTATGYAAVGLEAPTPAEGAAP